MRSDQSAAVELLTTNRREAFPVPSHVRNGCPALRTAGMRLTLADGAAAASRTVPLGAADSFAILAGTPNITGVPTSTITAIRASRSTF